MLADPPRLRATFARTGVLRFTRYLPLPALDRLREELVELLGAAGILETSAAPAGDAGGGDGRAPAPFRADEAAARPAPSPARGARQVDPLLYRRLFALRALHELPHRSELALLTRLLLGTDDVLIHPRLACRVVLPAGREATDDTTPPHQDHLGMQGSTNAVSVWVPLVDCPSDLGPIAVAAGSHLLGRRPYRPTTGARVLPCDDAGLEASWVSGPLAAGDVVVFHALSVHRAPANRLQAVRLSVDFRCQPAAEPVCELTVRDDPALPWEEVYAGLDPASPLSAWRRLPLRLVPFDASVLSPA